MDTPDSWAQFPVAPDNTAPTNASPSGQPAPPSPVAQPTAAPSPTTSQAPAPASNSSTEDWSQFAPAPTPQAAPAAQPQGQRMWSPDEEKQLSAFIQTAKSPQEIVDYSRALSGGKIMIPLHGINGTLGATEAIAWRDAHNGQPPTSYLVPQGAVSTNPNQPPPDSTQPSMPDKPDTLSGKTPVQVQADMAALPPEQRGGSLDSILHGLTFGLTSDIAGGTTAAENAILHPINAWNSGGQSIGDAYHQGRTLALEKVDSNNLNHPILAPIEDIGGSLLTPMGEANGISTAARVGRQALIGGGLGMVSGFENNNGDLSDRLTSAAKQGAGGLLIGGGLGAAFGKIGSSGSKAIDAADNLSRDGTNIDLPWAVTGGTAAQRTGGGVLQTLGGGSILKSRVQTLGDQLQAVGNRTANEAVEGATPQTPNLEQAAAVIGDKTVPGSLADYAASSKANTDALYNGAFNQAGNTAVQTPQTVQLLNDKIALLNRTPGQSPGLDKLVSLRDDLVSQPYQIDALHNLRTTFGNTIDSSDGAIRGMSKQLWGSLSNDMTNGLQAAGKPAAADALNAADNAWSQRASNLEDVVPKILGIDGSASNEQIANNIVSLSRSDGANLSKALGLMDPQSRAEVQGNLINHLGLAGDGSQNAAGNAFNPSTWATNWSKMSDDTKRLVFRGQTRQDLDDLATVVNQVKSSGRMNNSSNTAGASNVMHILTGFADIAGGVAAGHFAGWEAGVGTAVGAGALSVGLGTALASPGVARGLVRVAQGQTAQQVSRRIIALSRNPALAPFASALVGMATGGTTAQPKPAALPLPPLQQ